MNIADVSNGAAGASFNVVPLPVADDTFITPYMARMISETAARFLPHWFTCRLVREMNGTGRREDFILVQHDNDPTGGSFSIHREPGRMFSLIDPDMLAGSARSWNEPGLFKTPAAAIEAIATRLDRRAAGPGKGIIDWPAPCDGSRFAPVQHDGNGSGSGKRQNGTTP